MIDWKYGAQVADYLLAVSVDPWQIPTKQLVTFLELQWVVV